MAKLTGKQMRQLVRTLNHLERAHAFISKDSVAVCRRSSMPTTTLDYEGVGGDALTPIDKEIGSDLTGLEMGIHSLREFIIDWGK